MMIKLREKAKERLKNLLKKSIVKEFSWLTFSAILTQIFAFVGMIFVSRYLGPINLGLFAFVQNYIGLCVTVVGGMDFYFTYHIAKSHKHIEDVFKYIVQKTQVAFILFFIGMLGAFIFLPKDVLVLTSILFLPILLNGCSAFISYAMSQRMAKLVSVVQILVASIFFSSKIAFVYFKLPLSFFVAIQALDIVASGLILALYFLLHKKWIRYQKDFIYIKFKDTLNLLYEIRYNMVLVIFWQLVIRSDQLMLAKLTSAYNLGIYAAAVKLAEAPNAIVAVLGLVAYPRIVNYVQTRSVFANHQIKRFMYLFLGSGILIATSLFVFAKYIIHILYGIKFEGSIVILMIYSFSIPGLFLCYYYMTVFGAMEERKWPAIISILSAMLNISLVIILTKYFGITGTAFASVASYSVSGLIFHLAYKYYVKSIDSKNIKI